VRRSMRHDASKSPGTRATRLETTRSGHLA
jgi:hypothetical protein